MTACPEFLSVTPEIVAWSIYSESVKTYLCSAAHVHLGKVAFIDPVIPERETIWRKIEALGSPNLIVLTNGNHERDARKFADECGIPIAASAEATAELTFKPDVILNGQPMIQGLRPIPCPGAGPGEYAFFSESTSTLFLGDALINLPDTGVQLLPKKYCVNHAQNITSLARLLALPFERILMAHGMPIISHPHTALKNCLKS